MLDTSILQQVTEIFRNLEADYTFRISYSPLREEICRSRRNPRKWIHPDALLPYHQR